MKISSPYAEKSCSFMIDDDHSDSQAEYAAYYTNKNTNKDSSGALGDALCTEHLRIIVGVSVERREEEEIVTSARGLIERL